MFFPFSARFAGGCVDYVPNILQADPSGRWLGCRHGQVWPNWGEGVSEKKTQPGCVRHQMFSSKCSHSCRESCVTIVNFFGEFRSKRHKMLNFVHFFYFFSRNPQNLHLHFKKIHVCCERSPPPFFNTQLFFSSLSVPAHRA